MYVGRIVAIGQTTDGRLAALYRVSSRSFPNRVAQVNGTTVSIVPKEGFEADIRKNPYISYHCLRTVGTYAVATNGSHTDPITEKLASGMGMRDAMVYALGGLDYEHDDYNTPRIAAVADSKTRRCAIGIVRSDALLVRELDLPKGVLRYVATYEHDSPDDAYGESDWKIQSAVEGCAHILGKGVFADLERPIVAACAIEEEKTFSVAVQEAGAR
jgi:IMP cyclohydrolase